MNNDICWSEVDQHFHIKALLWTFIEQGIIPGSRIRRSRRIAERLGIAWSDPAATTDLAGQNSYAIKKLNEDSPHEPKMGR